MSAISTVGKSTTLAYMDHPLSDPDTSERQDNIAFAISWYGFLLEHAQWAIEATWLMQTHVDRMNDQIRIQRLLNDQVTILNRCDVLVLVGGRISGHMIVHRSHCETREIPVLDLTWLGQRPQPPTPYQRRKLKHQVEMIERLLEPSVGD